MLNGAMNIYMVYRVCLKGMTTICPNSKIMSHKGKTTLFQIDFNKTNISIPKTITWSEIELPQSWKFERIVSPQVIKRNAEKITENEDGDVEIFFGRPNSLPSFEASSSCVKGIFVSDQQIPLDIYTDDPSFSLMEFKINTYQFKPNREKCSKEFML